MAFERFWSKVDKTGECWLWTAALTRGYGQLTYQKRHTAAHRFSWEIEHGTIPAGMIVCHRCDTPACVRPSHLFLGTHADNVRDKITKGRARTGNVRGQNNPSVRNKTVDADRVRTLFASGMKVREIAPLVGVSKSTVSNIIRGKHWSVTDGI